MCSVGKRAWATAVRHDLLEVAHLAHVGAHAAERGDEVDLVAVIGQLVSRLKSAATATYQSLEGAPTETPLDTGRAR